MSQDEQDEQTSPESAQEPVSEEPEIKVGYLVGLDTSGNFVFDVVGTDKGLVELLGLHNYASERLRILLNNTTGGGDKLVQQMGAALLDMNKKLDKLVQLVTPKNKL